MSVRVKMATAGGRARTHSILIVNLSFFALAANIAFAESSDSVRCYVWDFAMRNGDRNELTRQLTVEFEEKLARRKFCKVLERRNFARLVAQKDNERSILRLEGISKATVDTLQANDANTVIFGEVYDDINSGSYKVTVTFQRFDNTKNIWSTSIKRGLINDASSREKAMEDLVKGVYEDSRLADREANKRKYYGHISKVMNEFILRARNLKDAFRFLPDLAFGNRRFAQDISLAVLQYNQVLDSVKINRDALIEEVATNWQKPEIADDFERLIGYIVFDIHETEMLVFNDILVKIMSILNGKITNASEVEAIKMNVKTTVPIRVESLNAKLIQVERNSFTLLSALKP